MTTREVVIGHRLGLHARASAKLVRLSEEFKSVISISRFDHGETKTADARSILAILLLAAGQGTRLRIQAEGEDEEQATEAICRYLEG
jgi:phosphocarrier protein HPr